MSKYVRSKRNNKITCPRKKYKSRADVCMAADFLDKEKPVTPPRGIFFCNLCGYWHISN